MYQSSSLQPVDKNGSAVPVLGLGSAVVSLAIPNAAASAATALPTNVKPGDVIRVANSAPCYLAFGAADVTVNTNNALLMAPEYFKVLDGHTHFRVYGLDAGVITINLAE